MRTVVRSLGRQVARKQNVMRVAKPFAVMASSRKMFSSGVAAPVKENKMFCFQCEQTEGGKGCTTVGVCGKSPEVAALQDTLLHACKSISNYAHQSAKLGVRDADVDTFVKEAMFSTLTNVDFDPERFVDFLRRADEFKQKAKATFEKASGGKSVSSSSWSFDKSASVADLVADAKQYGVEARKAAMGDDIAGLGELVTYGLKGMCAYADHAHVLGIEDPEVDAVIHEVLDYLSKDKWDANELLGHAIKLGHTNIKVMGNLNHGAVTKYGHPEPTRVRTTAVKGKCILVSGHDLRDLELILQQTEGKGINVYTHGEMLPGHAYPELKKYKHLVANYGGAWQEQKLDFSLFPGPIVMTTNCIIEPRKSYKSRIFTRGVVGWPGCGHIPGDDMSEVIALAESLPGFEKDEVERHTMTGFGHNAVLSHAGTVVDLVKSGKLKHFFLIGGCDGSEGERSYFRDLALSTPKDTMVLTLACGKYRFNKRFDEFGEIGGLPRMLDIGQCNDAYSAIQIAAALANAFGTDVNGLPLSFAVSWFEQKAVAVLLSLLALDIRNIRLGPKLPAFVTPPVLNILVDKFQIKPIGDPKQDLKDMLANK